MRCPSCSCENRDDATFCGECGSGLRSEVTCASCGRSNPVDRKFCDRCGSRLSEAVAPFRTPTPEPSPTLPTSFADGRYRVKSFLGEGGRKRVYRARDSKLDRDVAIALIKTEGLDEGGLERVRREAQAMGRLGDHPNIVTVFDIGDEGGQPYIVSQYMAGGDLEGLLRDGGEHPLPLDESLRIASEVCEALQHAHERGVVHRDLKPGNVWLTEGNTAKLGDFGLAFEIDQSRLTREGLMVGTSLYMPPEQALGGEVTPRSDLYALGCLIYEMVAGRPPFVGDDPTTVISQHIHTAPVAPSWLTEHCPPDLEELVLRLLAKDPGERPESAAEVGSALQQVDPMHKSAARGEANVLDRLAKGVFVGRERELDRLRKAFDSAFAGRGGMVMLVGEPGIGKTRTAQELETYARMRGAQVLWGMAHESAGAPAYWPWIQVGRGHAWASDPTQLGSEVQGIGPELARIFPELRRQVPDIPEAEPVTDPEAAQFRLFDAYATFIRALANRTPLLIALDDLHWADKPSLLLLQHLARELSRMRVLVVGNFRDTELSRTHPLSEALSTLNRESGFQRVVLRGLSRDEVTAYVRSTANVEPRRELLERIYEETEGNPFFLSEVVRLLTQEGALTRESVSDIAVPDGVREALGRRLDRISEEANELLQVAAVAGREFAYETLTLLGDRDEEQLLGLIEEALEARVIEEMAQPGRYRFTHALMQETLLSELSTTRRVRLHGQIGDALERRWGDRAEQRPTRLAQHFVEASTLTPRHAAKAIHYSKLSAKQAEAQSAWDQAARHYEACLPMVTEVEDGLGEDEAELLMAFGTCARNAGDYRKSWRALMRAINLYRNDDDAFGMARATLEALLVVAPAERHVALAKGALAMLGDRDPYLEARLLSFLAHPAMGNLLGSAERERVRQRASELGATHGFEDVQARMVLVEAGYAWESAEWEQAAKLNREAYDRFARMGVASDAARAVFAQATSLLILGDLDRGRSLCEEGLEYAQEHGIRYGEENCAGMIASVLLARCDLEAFDELALERSTDASYIIQTLRASRAEMAGDLEEAVRLLPNPELMGGVPVYLASVHAARARVFLNVRRDAEARQEFSRVREALSAYPLSRFSRDVAAHPLVLGALDEALPVLADGAFMRAIRSLKNRGAFDWTGRSADRTFAAVDLALGFTEDAEHGFRAGLDWCNREGCPVEAGRCLQGLSEVAELRGNIDESLQLLDRAAAKFQQHGARLYLDRVIAKKVKLQGIESGDIKSSVDAVAAIVETEHPDLSPQAAPDGTVTILFSDIEGSTEMTERLGDQRWLELLHEHNSIIRRQVAECGGFEVKAEGDGFMLAFQSARTAVECAKETQRAFARRAESSEEPIKIRIGLHTGEAIREGEDFFGKHVILAARIASQAKGGQILVSSLLKELTESAGDVEFGEGREVELKGLAGPHRVFEVVWR